MSDFYKRVEAMLKAEEPGKCVAMLAAMGIHAVKPLGEKAQGQDIMSLMLQAAIGGIPVYFLASDQQGLGTLSKSFAEKLNQAGGHGAIDNRYPGFASGHHQKSNVTKGPDGEWSALASSADFFYARWDTLDHSPVNPNRTEKGGPTHDTGLKVRGTAVKDLLLSFAESWNDSGSADGTSPPIEKPIPAELLEEEMPLAGPHSVQVLRTYVLIDGPRRYSWSDVGEYSIWAAYLNALNQARRYIYIEDQYLYTFHDPPFIEKSEGKSEQQTMFTRWVKR